MNRTKDTNPWRTSFLVLASCVVTAAMLGLTNSSTSTNASSAFNASGAGNVVVFEQGEQIFIVGPQNYAVMRMRGFKGVEKIGSLN